MKLIRSKYLILTAAPILVLVIAGAGIVQAHGMGNSTPADYAQQLQEKFQREADTLGVSVDVIKDGWAQGKTFLQIAEDQGIDEATLQNKLRDQQKSDLKARLQTLADQGTITQTQADQRYFVMLDRINSSAPGKGWGRMFGGMNGRHGPRF